MTRYLTARNVLYLLLAVVAAAAAVLSFAALRDLAIVCGFDRGLAWLLPVVIDAGAAAGSLAWLGSGAPNARRTGRAMALVLLASSIGGNALGHALTSGLLPRDGWIVVGVSAVAPAVLGALVHLVVLAVRTAPATDEEHQSVEADAPVVVVEDETPQFFAPPTPEVEVVAEMVRDVTRHGLRLAPAPQPSDDEGAEDEPRTLEEMVAAGWGRGRIARALRIKPHEARALLEAARA